MRTWIAVVNRSEARFFETNFKKNGDLKFLFKMENPKGRLKSGEINADKPGYLSGSATLHGVSLTKPQSPVERVCSMFSKEIAACLEENRVLHKFDQLILFAEPHFLGILRSDFPKPLSSLIVKEFQKDLRAVSNEQLRERLWPSSSKNEPVTWL